MFNKISTIIYHVSDPTTVKVTSFYEKAVKLRVESKKTKSIIISNDSLKDQVTEDSIPDFTSRISCKS